MRLWGICFTPGGEALAHSLLARAAGWETCLAVGYGSNKADLTRWTEQAFSAADALLFVGAAGIAVRAVAPFIKSKTVDPAVLVMDEEGRYVIPLLSGHIGGANHIARRVAELCGGVAVITTATDVKGLVGLDDWAVRQGLAIINPEAVKTVSARLLRGEAVAVYSSATLEPPLPQGLYQEAGPERAQVVISPYFCGRREALHLVPPCVAVGIGCRRGAAAEAIEALLEQALAQVEVLPQAVCGVFSIDRKAGEPGITALCKARGWGFTTYSAQRLRQVEGSVSSSEFVYSTTGVDTVCERSALAGGGRLILPKQAGNGITVALAVRQVSYRFTK